MRSAFHFSEPSRPQDTAAEMSTRAQPFSVPLGTRTGAPPQTRLETVVVSPLTATRVVQETVENRFVTLIAPVSNFTIYIAGGSGVSTTTGIALPPGLPYEISLPGNQAIYAISDAPGITLRLRVQVAAAIVGDLERRL